jgi:F plasmid transfer operon protein
MTPPATSLRDVVDGAVVELASVTHGSPALLFVCKADCPACEVAGPVLARFAAIPGLALVAISQDDAAAAQAFANHSGFGEAVRTLLDPPPWASSDAFGVAVTPTFILLGASGEVAGTCEGWHQGEVNALAAHAAELCGVAAPVVSVPGGAEPPWRPG